MEYTSLKNPVRSSEPVIEFFSFYCGPCYLFRNTYHVDSTVAQSLPVGTKLVKYHVGLMGKLGNELTEAWSVAMVLGIEDKMEDILFNELQKERALNTLDDIKRAFSYAGVTSLQYENTRKSLLVKGLIAKQNEAVKALDVQATPAFYVLGKYKIENAGITDKSVEGYAKEYTAVIDYLLSAKP